MKIIFTYALLLISTIASGQSRLSKAPIVYTVDLNYDGKVDLLSIYTSQKDNASFNKIVISITGYGKQTFIARNSWTNVDSVFLRKNVNAVQSKRFFLTGNAQQSVILLFGQLYDDGREEFSIINIENNKAKMVFDHTSDEAGVEYPVKVSDLDNDGKLDFIYTQYGEMYEESDRLNASIGTYHPYYVYSIDSTCVLNKPLTKKYNEEHYVFAGYKYSDKIKVVYPHNGGKPWIMK